MDNPKMVFAVERVVFGRAEFGPAVVFHPFGEGDGHRPREVARLAVLTGALERFTAVQEKLKEQARKVEDEQTDAVRRFKNECGLLADLDTVRIASQSLEAGAQAPYGTVIRVTLVNNDEGVYGRN